MKIWPWSTIGRLRKELVETQMKLEACGLAAVGAFNGLHKPQYFRVEVMALRLRFDEVAHEQHQHEPPQQERPFAIPQQEGDLK